MESLTPMVKTVCNLKNHKTLDKDLKDKINLLDKHISTGHRVKINVPIQNYRLSR